jgi:hypothetical protein
MSTTDTAEAPDALDALELEADQLEGAAVQVVEEAKEEKATKEAASMVDDLVEVLKMARTMVGTAFVWWPDFEKTWSDAVLTAIATNGAILMQRHGWTMGRLMSEWGPYIGLLGCMLPPAYATWLAIQNRKELMHERAQQAPN